MWQKRISEVTQDDIRSIVATARQEGLRVEFKRDLSDSKENEKAKKVLARELVAFANSQGGTLILGVNESKDHRAEGINPLANCRALAGRLGSAMSAMIDPPIPGFECEGISTEDDGSGVVVMRVPHSLSAPHWVRLGNDSDGGVCFVRRNTSAVPVSSMRDIHEMVLNAEGTRGRLQERFEDLRRLELEALLGFLNSTATSTGFEFSLFALPLSPIQNDGLLANSALNWPKTSFPLMPPSERHEAFLPVDGFHSRTRIRGFQRTASDDWGKVVLDEGMDGSVSTLLLQSPNSDRKVYYGYIAGALASTLTRVEAMRIAAGAPETEYELRVRSPMSGFTNGERPPERMTPMK